METGKIIVKSVYEQEGDLVLRSLVRALKKINATTFLDGDNAIIYGRRKEDGLFHELLTNRVIDYDNILPLDDNDTEKLLKCHGKELLDAIKVIEKIVFNMDVDLDFEVSTMEELAKDRAIEFNAYNDNLSRVNPYVRLGDEMSDPNGYNQFEYKCRKLKKVKKM